MSVNSVNLGFMILKYSYCDYKENMCMEFLGMLLLDELRTNLSDSMQTVMKISVGSEFRREEKAIQSSP